MRIAASLFLTILLFLVSCGDPASGGDSTNAENTEAADTQEGPVDPKNLPPLPSLMIERLLNELDNIDYQFAELPISMNMNTPSAIRQSLSHIANQGVISSEGCQPSGNIWYGSEGEIILEAEFYLGEGCNFFVFSEDGVKKWANGMTFQGIQFYNMTKQRAGFE